MTIYGQIQDILKDRIGSTITASEIKHALKARFGTNASSIIPSDFCYNRVNDGIKFDKHIFKYIDHNNYKYLGKQYPFTGLIFHKPTGQTNEIIVGEWIAGRKIFYLTPVPKDSVEGLQIIEHSSRIVVKIVDVQSLRLIPSKKQDYGYFIQQIHSASQIRDLISRADDYEETRRLILKLAGLKKTRTPYYLNINDLDEIFHWKLRRQYYRQLRNIQKNTDEQIRIITKSAFSVSSNDERITIELMLRELVKLYAVQIPVASAIMTLCYPDKYCVIDFRGWRQVYGKEKEYGNYTIREYLDYWTKIKSTAIKYGVTPQEVDMAIWQYDIENHRR